MKTNVRRMLQFCRLIAIGFLLTGSTAGATTYTYVGQPFTSFSSSSCNASDCTRITGSVTFNFDTSHFSGTLSSSDVDTAYLSVGIANLEGLPFEPGPYVLYFPSTFFAFNPPSSYGFSSNLATTDFTLVNGDITSWLLSGAAGQVNCGTGPGCAAGSFGATSASDADSASAANGGYYPFYASNSGGGVWTETPASIAAAVPEPSSWAMMILGLAGIGTMTYRRRKSAALAA
jgi:PEP-CTERM motif